MAYIEIFPKSIESQITLEQSFDEMSQIIFKETKNLFNISDLDIIIEINQCQALKFNQTAITGNAAPDVVMKISTSDKILQPKFQDLCDRILECWEAIFSKKLKLEIWMNLIDIWGSNIEIA